MSSLAIQAPATVREVAAPAKPTLTRVVYQPQAAQRPHENPAHNFAIMGIAWLITLLTTIGLFVLINSL